MPSSSLCVIRPIALLAASVPTPVGGPNPAPVAGSGGAGEEGLPAGNSDSLIAWRQRHPVCRLFVAMQVIRPTYGTDIEMIAGPPTKASAGAKRAIEKH